MTGHVIEFILDQIGRPEYVVQGGVFLDTASIEESKGGVREGDPFRDPREFEEERRTGGCVERVRDIKVTLPQGSRERPETGESFMSPTPVVDDNIAHQRVTTNEFGGRRRAEYGDGRV
jgi:hypothetical protein